MTMAPSEDLDSEFVCSYSIGGPGEGRVQCGLRAEALVIWPPTVTDKRTMTYCKRHLAVVEDMLNLADDVIALVGHDVA